MTWRSFRLGRKWRLWEVACSLAWVWHTWEYAGINRVRDTGGMWGLWGSHSLADTDLFYCLLFSERKEKTDVWDSEEESTMNDKYCSHQRLKTAWQMTWWQIWCMMWFCSLTAWHVTDDRESAWHMTVMSRRSLQFAQTQSRSGPHGRIPQNKVT